MTSPWVSYIIAPGFPVNQGASLGADGIGYFGNSVDNKIFKFDYRSGAVISTFQAVTPIISIPAIHESLPMIFASTTDPLAKIYGIDNFTMNSLWLRTTGTIAGSPILGPEGDVTFSTASGDVMRVGAANFQIKWWIQQNSYTPPQGTLVFTRDDTKLIFSNGPRVMALNWSNGVIAWTTELGSQVGGPATAPDGTVIVGSDSGLIYGLRPGSGTILWTFAAHGKVHGAPGFSPDGTVVYMPCYDSNIYALRVTDGSLLWSFDAGSACEQPATIGVDGRVYFHTVNGDIYCVSPIGNQVWKAHVNCPARGPMTIGPDGTLYVGFCGPSGQTGLAMIRQQSLSLPPSDFAVERGLLVSGGLGDVVASDNSYMVFRPGFTLNSSEDPVRIVYSAHSAFSPISEIKLKVEAHASLVGLVRRIDLWNFPLNRWDVISETNEATGDNTTALDILGGQSYADVNGLVKLRVRWKAAGPIASSSWNTSTDLVHFDIVPQFKP